MIKTYVLTAILAAMVALGTLAGASPASASAWGPYHDVGFRLEIREGVYEHGSYVDQVRVKHLPHATRCDFKHFDRFDTKLVSIDAPVRACIPGKVLFID